MTLKANLETHPYTLLTKMKVRIKLAEILEARGISNRELSRLTGIRHPSINEMVNNETARLPLDNLARICEILGVDIPDILELINEEKAPTPVKE